MKRILYVFVGLVIMITSLVGCAGNQKEVKTYGYGDSVDGKVVVGDWNYISETSIATKESKDKENIIFKEGLKDNFSFSIKMTVEEIGNETESLYGGYAYYKDSSNNVKFLINTKDKVLQAETVKGYDKQNLSVYYPDTVDVKKGITVKSTKIGNEFRFAVDGILVGTMMETFEGAGQIGLIANYTKVAFEDVTVKEETKFELLPILNNKYKAAEGVPGDWVIEGNKVARTDTDPATATKVGVAFNSALANNYRFKATAKQTAKIDGGFGLYGVVAYYQNPNNFSVVFFNGIYVDVMVMVEGAIEWTGGMVTPNVPQDGNNIVEGVKFGNILRVYVNGVFIRELTYESFSRPGWVGYETNGAAAEFEMVELEMTETMDNELYKKDTMIYANFADLLKYEDNTYTTLPYETVPNIGANYGADIETGSAIVGDNYEYNVELDTSKLQSAVNNYIGVYAAKNIKTKIAIVVKANGKCDLYGVYNDMEGNEVKGFAGLEKDLPSSAFTEGALNSKIKVECEKTGRNIEFKINGETMFNVEIARIDSANPGLIANYVGASFKVI